MRRIATSLTILTMIAGATSPLLAQRRDRGLVELPSRSSRSGFYFTAEVGAGREQCKFETAPCAILAPNGSEIPADGNSKWRKAVTSPAFALRIGGTPSSSTRVGLELNGWSADNGPTKESTVGLLGNIQFYPARDAGLYLKGGLGYGWSSVEFEDRSKATESGFMFNVGAGYDIPLSRNFSIAPVIDFYQGAYPGAIGDETLTERILFVGVSVTLQSGRRR